VIGHHPVLPTTPLGRAAAWLALAFVLLNFSWRILGPLGGFPALLVGLASGVVALVAIARRRERALTAYLAVLPLALVVLFLLAEFLIPH